MSKRHGGCLCGQIRYEFTAEPVATVHCHCTDCQKATGSGFATVVGVEYDAFALTGTDTLGSFSIDADSGQRVTRQFCANCGSPLLTLAENNPNLVWVKAGSLDDSDWLAPTMSCWTGSARPWAKAYSDLEHHPTNP